MGKNRHGFHCKSSSSKSVKHSIKQLHWNACRVKYPCHISWSGLEKYFHVFIHLTNIEYLPCAKCANALTFPVLKDTCEKQAGYQKGRKQSNKCQYSLKSKSTVPFLHFRNYGIWLTDFVGIFGLLHNLFTLFVLSLIIEQYKQFCFPLNNCSPFRPFPKYLKIL